MNDARWGYLLTNIVLWKKSNQPFFQLNILSDKHFSINAIFLHWNLQFLNFHLTHLKLLRKDFKLLQTLELSEHSTLETNTKLGIVKSLNLNMALTPDKNDNFILRVSTASKTAVMSVKFKSLLEQEPIDLVFSKIFNFWRGGGKLLDDHKNLSTGG